MTEFRGSNLHPDAMVFREEPPWLGGSYLSTQNLAGTMRATALQSLGQGVFITGGGWAKEGWEGLRDYLTATDSEQLTPEIYEELIQNPIMGTIDIPFDPSLSVRQFKAQLGRFRRESMMAQVERSVLGNVLYFGGAMGGGMVSPEVLITLPVGGKTLAAIRGMSTGMAMRQSIKAGLEISAAATPLNILMQDTTYGRVDPVEVAATAIAPIAFTPASVAFFRAISPKARVDSAAAQSVDMAKAVPVTPETDVPSAIRNVFSEFDGGAERWLSSYARREADAVAFVDQLGLDDTARRHLDDIIFREAAHSHIDSISVREMQALINAGQGRIGFDDAAFLASRGLLEEAEAMRLAATRPPIARDAVDLVALRGLEQRRAALVKRLPELRDALRWEDFANARRAGVPGQAAVQNVARNIQNAVRKRDPNLVDDELRPIVRNLIAAEEAAPSVRNIAYQREQRTLDLLQRAVDGDETATPRFMERMMALLPEHAEGDARALRQGGLDSLRLRYLNRLADEIDVETAKLGAAVEAQRGVGGRTPKAILEQQKALKARIAELEAQHDRIRSEVHQAPESISVDELAEVLDASVIERIASPQAIYAQGDDFAPVTRRPATEADFEGVSTEVAAFARQHGVDPADLANTPAGRAQRILEECV